MDDQAQAIRNADGATDAARELLGLTCVACGGTGWVPHPELPYTRNVPCPDCNQGKP